MYSFRSTKNIEPLNLDLADLSGGGACPSQFHGTTHDGRAVYIRYRHGALSVEISYDVGGDPILAGELIFEEEVGDFLDGFMSLTQVCKCLGVTVNGKVPQEVDPDAASFDGFDFSSATIFWKAYCAAVTEETSRHIVCEAMAAFPDALLVKLQQSPDTESRSLAKTTPQKAKASSNWLIFGVQHIDELELGPHCSLLPTVGQLHVRIFPCLWASPQSRYCDKYLDPARDELGREIWIAGVSQMPADEQLAQSSFYLEARFPSIEVNMRKTLEGLGEIFTGAFLQTDLHKIDLRTGETLAILHEPVDPVLTRWCRAGSDRWLSVHQDIVRDTWVGTRPAVA